MADLKISELGAAARRAVTPAAEPEARALWLQVAGDAERWLTRRELPRLTPALAAPPGDPFGIP